MAAAMRRRQSVPIEPAGPAIPINGRGDLAVAVALSTILGTAAAAVAIPWLVNTLRAPEVASRTRHRLAPVPLDDAAPPPPD